MTTTSKQRHQVARAIASHHSIRLDHLDFGNLEMSQEWIDCFRAKLDTLTDSSISIVLPPIDLVLATPDLTLAQRIRSAMDRVYNR